MRVPFVDLHAQYRTIRGEVDAAIARVIAESAFIRGPYVDAFEREYAAALGVSHCVSCANGTDGLFIALRGLGVTAGDEVITTAHSWIATSETITLAGGRVVFCDTRPDTFTIDPSQIERAITPRTRGIVVVHLYGQPADMDEITAIAARHGLWVIEDCAQAHAARYKGRLVGTFGQAATFSFYPGKNLGAMGDAGAIVTADGELARRMTMFARHGGVNKGDHEIEGINSRMDGLQAAILSAKLPHLPAWTRARRELASAYDRGLAGIAGLVTPVTASDRDHVFHLYVVRSQRRDTLRAWLKQRGIETGVHYPTALPLLRAYSYLGHRPADFPSAAAAQSEILSLPLYPEMTAPMQAHVIDAIREFHAPAADHEPVAAMASTSR
jgi:dTDP-4-amino-4,6-dideoxygalactose transaminase